MGRPGRQLAGPPAARAGPERRRPSVPPIAACNLRIPAFAKINLSLEVIGRRDDGYHDVATILQTIDLADELALEPANTLSVTCDDPGLAGESNIVWRAATNLASRAGILPRARIHITKRIPVAAGLGGGSADAAAALLGLNRMWELNLATPELHQVAATLGSDVPFLLTGGTALATGRGDVLHPLPPLPETHVSSWWCLGTPLTRKRPLCTVR